MDSALAQSKDLDLVAGIGFPEMLQIGFNAGISPRSDLGFNAGARTSGFEAIQLTIEQVERRIFKEISSYSYVVFRRMTHLLSSR